MTENINQKILSAIILTAITFTTIFSQTLSSKTNESSTPLYLMKPDYPVHYGPVKVEEIVEVLTRVRNYLDATTPTRIINRQTKQEITNLTKPNNDAIIEQGDFRLISYEWGVTYGGMLLAGEVTGDSKFTEYTTKRIKFIADMVPYFQNIKDKLQKGDLIRSVLEPRALDDAGSMCAAMIKFSRTGVKADVRPLIDNYINYISTKEFRLADGTLARNRPLPNSLWLDDLYMSVPALAQMGKLTGDQSYFDDAVKQILQYSKRMFNTDNKNLFIHGWIQGMDVHPDFHWARANGWAILSMVELLDVLPEDHPGRADILELLRKHIRGLAACQSGMGFWHQLLDRNDAYLETSATAIYTYCIAHAINKGWIDPIAHGSMVMIGWNALKTKVNAQGQVEGTCVGTGMGFDPMFYYYRPTNPFAAHGYGPLLLAGAEMIKLIKNYSIEIHESSVLLTPLNRN